MKHFFNRKQICAYLAYRDIPAEPSFELRKVTFIKHYLKGKKELQRQKKLFSSMFIEDRYQHIQLPKPYLNYPFGKTEKNSEFLVEKLNDNDVMMICSTLQIEGIKNNDEITKCKDLQSENAKKILKHFDICSSKFNESRKLGDWYLAKVAVPDSQKNYKLRNKYYEELLYNRLEVFIKDRQVIFLAQEQYKLPKFINIQIKAYVDKFDYVFNFWRHEEISKKMAEYWSKLNHVEEIEIIKYKNQLNRAIKEAILCDELPVYEAESFIPVEFCRKVPKLDYIIFWSDLRYILKEKLPKTMIPDLPVFLETQEKLENVYSSTNQNFSEELTSKLPKNERAIKTWLRTTWVNENRPGAKAFFIMLNKYKMQNNSPILQCIEVDKRGKGIEYAIANGRKRFMSLKSIQNNIAEFKKQEKNTVNSK